MKSKATKSATVYVDNVAPGTIVMWSGTLDNIPNGYALCDGSNKTPNLVDKFVYSSNEQSKIGQVGGNTNNQVKLQGDNVPQITGGSHHHSMDFNSGAHQHNYAVFTMTPSALSGPNVLQVSTNKASSGSSVGLWLDQIENPPYGTTSVEVNVNGPTYSETVTIGNQTPTAVDITPEYVALAFIMKKYPTS